MSGACECPGHFCCVVYGYFPNVFMGRKTKRFFCGMGKCGARCLLTKRYGKREIKTE